MKSPTLNRIQTCSSVAHEVLQLLVLLLLLALMIAEVLAHMAWMADEHVMARVVHEHDRNWWRGIGSRSVHGMRAHGRGGRGAELARVWLQAKFVLHWKRAIREKFRKNTKNWGKSFFSRKKNYSSKISLKKLSDIFSLIICSFLIQDFRILN